MGRIGIILLIMSFLGCSYPKWYTVGVELIKELYTITVTKPQLDSICVTDTLYLDLKNWNLVYIKDGENNTPIYRYMFIKNDNIIYTVTKEDSLYTISKRISK